TELVASELLSGRVMNVPPVANRLKVNQRRTSLFSAATPCSAVPVARGGRAKTGPALCWPRARRPEGFVAHLGADAVEEGHVGRPGRRRGQRIRGACPHDKAGEAARRGDDEPAAWPGPGDGHGVYRAGGDGESDAGAQHGRLLAGPDRELSFQDI